ncbi:MAG: hypothetical protein HZA25_00660 [Candidatus Niyogibacteria bacterium]|nr:hypothetical protein [Candidatus Niyogibacteria bacterium]
MKKSNKRRQALLVVTTAISGSGRKEYLARLTKYAARHGRKIKCYHVGAMMLDHAQRVGINLTRESVLNSHPSTIAAVRSAIFEKILGELHAARREYDAIFVNIHALFLWKNAFTRAWSHRYVSELDPDLVVTFAADVLATQKSLAERHQWDGEKLDIKDLLYWRNVDIEMASFAADLMGKKFYVVPSKSREKLLYRLLFEPMAEKVYAAMPITHMQDPVKQKMVDRFIRRLEKHFIVFDPREIELVEQWMPAMRTNAVLGQIVNRDLYWFIRQVDRVVAYFPEPASSPGAVNEMLEARYTNKDVYLVYPEGNISPFLINSTKKVFRSTGELWKFLAKQPSKVK